MTRPLYRSAVEEPPERPPEGHAGLWYDKFCNRWRVEGGHWTLSAPTGSDGAGPKLAWINTVASRVGDAELLQESTMRYLQLVEARGGRFAVFETESRFVTGLGRSHPIENGFAWHPTLGTPYLPGSSIKGMVRAWVKVWESQVAPGTVDRLFGKRGAVGEICFLDAVPTQRVSLDADIMTPHYAGWDETDPPGDWHSPNPIPFLVTAERTPFLFGLLPRRAGLSDELELVFGWLESALEWAGAGAKTAVGYGRMVHDEAATSELGRTLRDFLSDAARVEQLEATLGTLGPLEIELQEIASSEPGMAPYVAWMKALKDGQWSSQPEEERSVAAHIKAGMDREGKWRPESRARRPERDKDHQRTLEIMKFLGE